jgi:peptide deformylase
MIDKYKIRLINDPVLKTPTQKIEAHEDISILVGHMFYVMQREKAKGLAANQIGISKSIFVMSMEHGNKAFINPVIIEHTDPGQFKDEGCLSIPGVTLNTKRFLRVILEYEEPNSLGDRRTIELLDADAVCAQHELEHLSGKLFIDSLPPAKRQLTVKKHMDFIKRRSYVL